MNFVYFKNHLYFSVIFVFWFKDLVFFLQNNIDWFHVIFFSLLFCLLPDLDHTQSFLGRRLRIFSYSLSYLLNRRSFTHSLLSVFLLLVVVYYINFFLDLKLKLDSFLGITLGYLSHIISDMFTPMGVNFFWPFKKKIKVFNFLLLRNRISEYNFCLFFFFYFFLKKVFFILKK